MKRWGFGAHIILFQCEILIPPFHYFIFLAQSRPCPFLGHIYTTNMANEQNDVKFQVCLPVSEESDEKIEDDPLSAALSAGEAAATITNPFPVRHDLNVKICLWLGFN